MAACWCFGVDPVLIGVTGKIGVVFVFDGLGCDLAGLYFWQCLGELLGLILLDGFFFWTLEFLWCLGCCLLVTLNGVHRSIVDFLTNGWMMRCLQVRAKMNVWMIRLMPAMKQSNMLVIVISLCALSLSLERRILVSDFMKAMRNKDNFSRKVRKDAKMVVTNFGSLLFLLWWAQTCVTGTQWTSALPANCAGCVDWLGLSTEGKFVFLGTEDVLDVPEFTNGYVCHRNTVLGSAIKSKMP